MKSITVNKNEAGQRLVQDDAQEKYRPEWKEM